MRRSGSSVVRPDDSVGWQQWINRAFFAEDGQLVEFQSVGRDISERKRAEDTLRHEQELMRLLMDNIPDNIYFKDCESRYTRVNQALARFCGCTHPDEVCGKRDGDFYPADMADEFLADERRIFVSGERIIGKIEACAVDPARRRWFSTTKVPLRDAAGAIVGLVGISRDITAQKRVEEELRQHREHLEELVKRRTRELAEVNARLQEELAFTRHVI